MPRTFPQRIRRYQSAIRETSLGPLSLTLIAYLCFHGRRRASGIATRATLTALRSQITLTKQMSEWRQYKLADRLSHLLAAQCLSNATIGAQRRVTARLRRRSLYRLPNSCPESSSILRTSLSSASQASSSGLKRGNLWHRRGSSGQESSRLPESEARSSYSKWHSRSYQLSQWETSHRATSLASTSGTSPLGPACLLEVSVQYQTSSRTPHSAYQIKSYH